MNAQHPQNSNVYQINTYGKQYVTNYAPTNHGERAAATSYLERHAPDLIGMILGRAA